MKQKKYVITEAKEETGIELIVDVVKAHNIKEVEKVTPLDKRKHKVVTDKTFIVNRLIN